VFNDGDSDSVDDSHDTNTQIRILHCMIPGYDLDIG